MRINLSLACVALFIAFSALVLAGTARQGRDQMPCNAMQCTETPSCPALRCAVRCDRLLPLPRKSDELRRRTFAQRKIKVQRTGPRGFLASQQQRRSLAAQGVTTNRLLCTAVSTAANPQQGIPTYWKRQSFVHSERHTNHTIVCRCLSGWGLLDRHGDHRGPLRLGAIIPERIKGRNQTIYRP